MRKDSLGELACRFLCVGQQRSYVAGEVSMPAAWPLGHCTMLKQILLLWLSTRPIPTEAKSVGAFLIWSADERDWRVKGLSLRKVVEFTGYPAAIVESTVDELKETLVIAAGEVRKGVINCQLDVLHMTRSSSIRLAEAGYRAEFEAVFGYLEAMSPDMESRMETVVPFPGHS